MANNILLVPWNHYALENIFASRSEQYCEWDTAKDLSIRQFIWMYIFLTLTFICISQTSVNLVGTISTAFAISQVRLVKIGPQHWINADKKTRFLLMSKITKKMCFYSIYTMEQNPGWDWMIFSQKAPLLGQIVVPGTLQLGPKTNQTIFGMRTVYIHLVLNINMNGMT